MKIIAEIGNNHFGDLDNAKEHIRIAKEVGADYAKLQAFKPGDFKGSMPAEFYEKSSLTKRAYIELIDYGRDIGIDVFYSIFNPELECLQDHQRVKKISASQSARMVELNQFFDFPRAFVSFHKTHLIHVSTMENAIPLYASDYLTSDPELFRLEYMQKLLKRFDFGYSDHTIGIKACELAVKRYGATVIEKHFTLEKNKSFRGQVFRDTIHGADPKELERLIKLVRK